MRLSEFIEIEKNERAERRRLAGEKSYEILDRLDGVDEQFADISGGDAVGSVSPSIFVGRTGYPEVSTGLLSPVGNESDASQFVTDGAWYEAGVSIGDVFERRTSLFNASQTAPVETNVHDTWEGFLGVQREVALADPTGRDRSRSRRHARTRYRQQRRRGVGADRPAGASERRDADREPPHPTAN